MPATLVRPPAAVVAASLALALAAASSLGAQAPAGVPAAAGGSVVPGETPAPAVAAPKTVVAANLAGAFLGVTSLEAEHAFGRAVGVGAGVTRWSLLGGRALAYTSADVRLRYYVTGRAPAGLAVAAVGGTTRVSSAAAGRSLDALGAGFEVSWSELALPSKRLYLAVGAGSKWLKPRGTPLDGLSLNYPTVRAAVGWGF